MSSGICSPAYRSPTQPARSVLAQMSVALETPPDEALWPPWLDEVPPFEKMMTGSLPVPLFAPWLLVPPEPLPVPPFDEGPFPLPFPSPSSLLLLQATRAHTHAIRPNPRVTMF